MKNVTKSYVAKNFSIIFFIMLLKRLITITKSTTPSVSFCLSSSSFSTIGEKNFNLIFKVYIED